MPNLEVFIVGSIAVSYKSLNVCRISNWISHKSKFWVIREENEATSITP